MIVSGSLAFQSCGPAGLERLLPGLTNHRCWSRSFTGNSRLVAKHVSNTTQQVKHTSLFTLGFWSPTDCFKSSRRLRKVCLLLGSGAPSFRLSAVGLIPRCIGLGPIVRSPNYWKEVMRLIKPQGGRCQKRRSMKQESHLLPDCFPVRPVAKPLSGAALVMGISGLACRSTASAIALYLRHL